MASLDPQQALPRRRTCSLFRNGCKVNRGKVRVAFMEEYRRTYGHVHPGAPGEIVNLRMQRVTP